MQQFVNETTNKKEKAIKIGTNVPSGSIGLSWFSNKEVSPGNNIVTIDLSDTIQENRSPAVSMEPFLAYADELGFLRTLDGNYTFNNDDLTIGNILLKENTGTKFYSPTELNPHDFIHYYYVSKFFTVSQSGFTFDFLSKYLDPNAYKELKIKIIDNNGNDYVDEKTNLKKYRFLFEPFKTDSNNKSYELPYRIIALFDCDPPNNLRLVYDKVECDANGAAFGLELAYTETVNAVPYFDEIPEESFVIDDNYKNDRKYSVKKINQKHSDLVLDQQVDNGYQIVAPSKALDDHRNFEIFNWRLIARVNNSYNYDDINSGKELDVSSATILKTIKAGVLYDSSQTNETINPYVFYRLENSGFNLTGYSFINPNSVKLSTQSTSVNYTDKSYAAYWKVDINNDDLSDFDILVWSPSSAITSSQAAKLSAFTLKNGTLLLDLSQGADATKLNLNLKLSTDLIPSNYTNLNLNNVLIDPLKNGGWTITSGTSGIFESDNYNIYGANLKPDLTNSYKMFRSFNSYDSENTIINIGPSSSSTASIGKIIPVASDNASEVVRGNIVAVTFPVLEYCSKIYNVSSFNSLEDSNILDKDSTKQFDLFSGVVEGPFKFLYNTIAYAAYCRIEASRELRVNSSLYNFVSDWYSNWTMNQSVLLDDEKKNFFTKIPNEDLYGVDILDSVSIIDMFKSMVKDFFPSFMLDKIFGSDISSIEFFIEITNKNVLLSNATQLSSSSFNTTNNIASSYYLFKVNDFYNKVFAYTLTPSPQLGIPEGMGLYTILEKNISVSDTKVLANNLSILNTFKSYPFKLQSQYSYAVGRDKPIIVDATANLVFNAVVAGSATRTATAVTAGTPGGTNTTIVNAVLPCTNFVSAVDSNVLSSNLSNNPSNVFIYSGDIDIHHDSRSWKYATSGVDNTNLQIVDVVLNNYYITNKVAPKFRYLTFNDLNNPTFLVSWYASAGIPANQRILSPSILLPASYTFYSKKTNNVSANTSYEYVKYIQYTVTAATGIQLVVDGIYGPLTASAVKAFQNLNKERFIDGVVDSETKSFLALYWKNLKTTNLTKYTSLRTSANNSTTLKSIVKYIDATDQYGLASEIGTKTYKKLTFSGFSGPSEARDVIFFKIPDNVETINSIIITPDASPVWQNFYVDIYGYSSTDIKDIFKTTVVKTNQSVTNGKLVIPFNGITGTNARYIWVQLVGKTLNGYGYAEGFSIKSITVDAKIKETTYTAGTNPTTVTTTITENIYALATIQVTDNFNSINIANPSYRTYDAGTLLRMGGTITNLVIGCSSTGDTSTSSLPDGLLTVSNVNYPMTQAATPSSTYFKDGTIKFDFTGETSPSLNVPFLNLLSMQSATITSVVENNTVIPSSAINITPSTLTTNTGNGITVSVATSGVYYSSNGIHVSTALDLSTGYKLRTVNGYMYDAKFNSVDVNDGILLLCDTFGNPFGIPTNQSIYQSIAISNSSLAPEVDFRYGNISVFNSLGNDNGLIYGFYDINLKEFIGKVIPYIDYISRGVNNVFIGVCAIDADGNTQNKNEYFGPKVSMNFRPVNIPLKTVCPIYSVKMNRASSIKVNEIDPNLYKFDVWELPVTSGSFWKHVNIDPSRKWTGWKSTYMGQDLLAFYSTVSEFKIPSSKTYGKGYYDIIDEIPVLLDDKTICLRRTPLMNVNYPTNNYNTKAGVIKQEVHIYTRATTSDSWSEIDQRLIRDIDSNTGIIQFKASVIPSDNSLIKVSYTYKSKDIYLRQVLGNPIPLNPILNSDIISFNKPLYIYLTPKIIYKEYAQFNSNGPIGGTLVGLKKNLVRLTEYSYSSSVNFTYDSSIFDSRSSKYDPFALAIAIINIANNPYMQQPELFDIRVRGGGVTSNKDNVTLQQTVYDVLSYWDVYPPMGKSYSKGGYVVIQIPEVVKNYFLDKKEIYQIISNNLTAGIVYELQDMNGNPWT